MGAIAPQITSLKIVFSTVYSDADQRKHQSSASLAFVRGIHRGPANSPRKWPVTRKMLPFADVIMEIAIHGSILWRHGFVSTWSSAPHERRWVHKVHGRYKCTTCMIYVSCRDNYLRSWNMKHCSQIPKVYYKISDSFYGRYHNLSKSSGDTIMYVMCWLHLLQEPGCWFNIKMIAYEYRKSHCGDKTILRPSYLHNGIPYIGKTSSLYRIGTLSLM